jgi:hypothetical protein
VGFGILERGMPLAQLMALLEEDKAEMLRLGHTRFPHRVTEAMWIGRNWGIVVCYGPDGVVIQHSLLEIVDLRPPHGFVSSLRWYLSG